jgi:hypothetical protein
MRSPLSQKLEPPANPARFKQMMQTVHIHPTVSELIPTVLAGLKPLE